MKAVFTRGLVPALVIAGLNACGGGGGGSLLAGGGISGTGTGTITGFGSVIINDTREFAIDANTLITCDDEQITEQELMTRGLGSVVTITVGDDVSPDFTSGTAVTIDIGNLVAGPVTSLNPLQLLGQDVVITADSAYYQDGNPAATYPLALGDEVEINGFPDAAGTIFVSRIERVTQGIPDWKLTGTAAAPATTGDFNIGGQEVELGSVVPRNCTGNTVTPGDLVEVKATADPLFGPGDILATVTDVECITPGLVVPGNISSTVLRAEIEGLVTSLAPLVINGQTVTTGAGTVFEGIATANDIEIGMKLEAEGDLDTTTGILGANKIRLRDRRVRIEAPVNVPGAGLGSSFQILDVITVNTDSLTDDGDGLISGSGSSGNLQVEVRGYLDANDEVIATEVRDRGQADPTQVRLRGPVGTDTCNPAIADELFDILSVIVNTDPTVAMTVFADNDGSVLSQQGFCNLAVTDTFVQVEDGQFSSTPARIDNAGRIEIED